MRTARWLAVFLLIAGLLGCGSDEAEAALKMPDVIGSRLDVAKNDIERAGFDGKIEVLGGGTFGIVDESNWLVCEQLPAEGETIEDAPRLTVDRSCGDDADSDATKPADTTIPDTTSPDTTSPETTSPDTTGPPAEEEPTESGDAPAPAPTGIDAQAMEAAFIAGLASPIKDMCASARNDPTWTSGPHWACFYDGVEDQPGFLQINLTTDGGYAPEELEEMANETGRAWFNFIGCQFPNLDMIVVSNNGLDHNVPRSSTQADLLCD